MRAIIYQGPIRPHAGLTLERVMESFETVIMFLEQNGRSVKAREHLDYIEGLEKEIKSGQFEK